MDDDPEEYVQMKYSRDDEVPKGWAIRDLAQPVASQLGFYPASEFGVLTKLIQQVLGHVLWSCFVVALEVSTRGLSGIRSLACLLGIKHDAFGAYGSCTRTSLYTWYACVRL